MDDNLIDDIQQLISNAINPIKEKLDNIEDDIEFLNYKIIKNEKDIFKLKNKDQYHKSNTIKEIKSDVSLANVTSSKNRIDIEMLKNVINK